MTLTLFERTVTVAPNRALVIPAVPADPSSDPLEFFLDDDTVAVISATGQIWSGVWLTGTNGPEGWNWGPEQLADEGWPAHGIADDGTTQIRRYCLIASTDDGATWHFVGSSLTLRGAAGQRSRLLFAVNRPDLELEKNGTGEFSVTYQAVTTANLTRPDCSMHPAPSSQCRIAIGLLNELRGPDQTEACLNVHTTAAAIPITATAAGVAATVFLGTVVAILALGGSALQAAAQLSSGTTGATTTCTAAGTAAAHAAASVSAAAPVAGAAAAAAPLAAAPAALTGGLAAAATTGTPVAAAAGLWTLIAFIAVCVLALAALIVFIYFLGEVLDQSNHSDQAIADYRALVQSFHQQLDVVRTWCCPGDYSEDFPVCAG